MSMSSTEPVLRLVDVVKTYPGVVALKGVSLEVRPGEVHALVGENGAGKSTLIAVAAGATVPDTGTVEIGGQPLDPPTPAAAQALGLAVVYQHTLVLDDLTVTENLVYPMPRGVRPSIRSAEGWARHQFAMLGATVDPRLRAEDLTVAERQLLEIARAMALDSKVLVLDEPTESLTVAESERLFQRIAAVKARGTAVVYISHRLPEVKRIADRVTVLRDGEVRGTFENSAVSADDILRLIVGRSISQVFPAKLAADAPDAPLLEVRGLSGRRFHDVDLTVRRGEILGFAGIEGNGQREALRALGGMEGSRGDVRLDGHAVDVRDPHAAQASGMVLLPGDRHRDGLFLSLPVRENTSLLALARVATAGFVRRADEGRMVGKQIRDLAIRTPSAETPVASLSGGNQQKVLFARSLLSEPAVLLAEEPTRGVDVGARVELYRLLREAADAGRAVIVQSSDALELHGLCDRVMVFSRGTVVRTLEGDAFGEADITGAALTASRAADAEAGTAPRTSDWRRFLTGDYIASAVLAVLIVLLALYTGSVSEFFFTERNFQAMLLLGAAIAFVGLGQLLVVLVGGIDLSVGAVVGLTAVLLSFFVGRGASIATIGSGVVALVAAGVAIGLLNALLIRRIGLSPVIATLATFISIQGISLLLRSSPGGTFDPGVVGALKTSIGPVPVAFLVAVVLAIGAELVLRRARAGIGLRAVGSNEVRAFRLGAPVTRLHVAAYVGCSLFAVLGGVMLGSQVAIGDARLGSDYTLISITAVVLGGASIFGGRGSFIGALLGAVFLQEIVTATSFLRLGTAWQQWLPGVLILVAAAAYARARGTRAEASGLSGAAGATEATGPAGAVA
jgi:ribose transport system permease protein/ribose transport system ATP-binding protein